jgi:hypothetical protein
MSFTSSQKSFVFLSALMIFLRKSTQQKIAQYLTEIAGTQINDVSLYKMKGKNIR